MSYGQPWRRITGGPPAGPTSAYPMLRTPASICFKTPNEFVGFDTGFALVDCALSAPSSPKRAPIIVIAAVPRKRRRSPLNLLTPEPSNLGAIEPSNPGTLEPSNLEEPSSEGEGVCLYAGVEELDLERPVDD